jgi:threonine/homoserine/homoserine lactone efflux protein
VGLSFLVKGLLVGLSIAAPLGPVGILCMHQRLAQGPRRGLVGGLGAAAADALYALSGMVILYVIARWIIDDATALRVIGGIFLLYLGAQTFMRAPIVLPSRARMPSLHLSGAPAAFMSTFLLTLANPLSLPGFAAVFAGLGVAPHGMVPGTRGATSAAAALVLGVVLGSALWWLALTTLIGRLRTRISDRTLRLINRLCGTVLTAFGLLAMASLLPAF